jgi:DnaJ homolog subfamily C member 2
MDSSSVSPKVPSPSLNFRDVPTHSIDTAFDVLMNAERRRQFDSVDPYYMDLEEDTPTLTTFPKNASPEKFFKEFRPVFEREARFYKGPIEKVPMLGDMDDSKQKVEEFYDFWYKFDSWRSFEYLDKEVNEGSDK